MNLRQVLEAGACAAFAIANPDPAHFAKTTPEGTFETSQKLNAQRHKWLDTYFPQESSYIKEMKGQINNTTAHANIVYTQNTFRVADSGDEFSTPFFDIENECFVRVDLLKASGIAIWLINLFYQVNKDVHAIVWREDFDTRFTALIERERALKSEMRSSDFFKGNGIEIRTPVHGVSLEIVQLCATSEARSLWPLWEAGFVAFIGR